MLQGSVSVHLPQFELVGVAECLGLRDRLFGGKHLADLHERLVLGLRDDEEHEDGHGQAHTGKHQVAVGPSGHLPPRRRAGGEREGGWMGWGWDWISATRS